MQPYRETQYFHPIVYTIIAATIVFCGLLGAAAAAGGQRGATPAMLLALCGCLTLAAAALGRMIVEVDETRLSIRFGWLGLVRRTFELTRIRNARVCLFGPLREYLGWGWRFGLDGSVCYTTRGRRGLEISVDGQRHVVGSLDPQRLKCAILKERIDEVVEAKSAPAPPRFHIVRRRPPAPSDWGMLRPDDVDQECTLI